MEEKHLIALATKLDPTLWKNPLMSVRQQVASRNDNFAARPVLPNGKLWPCPPDYRDCAYSILRAGAPMSKEDKKKYGIHPLTKIGTGVLDHFTEKGLPVCKQQSLLLDLAISSIGAALGMIERCGEDGVEFFPARGTCEVCAKLRGVYNPNTAPLPVIDTHLGCRCGMIPGPI